MQNRIESAVRASASERRVAHMVWQVRSLSRVRDTTTERLEHLPELHVNQPALGSPGSWKYFEQIARTSPTEVPSEAACLVLTTLAASVNTTPSGTV